MTAERPSQMSERVARARTGDTVAFGELATDAYPQLFALAVRILRDRYSAEDAVQNALVHAWRDLRGLRDVERWEAWLHRLVVNACRDEARRASRRVTRPIAEIEPSFPGDPFAATAQRDALDRAFAQLSLDHRAVLVLQHYVGLTPPEIAVVIQAPVGTVHSRLHYALRAMRAALTADARPGDPATQEQPA